MYKHGVVVSAKGFLTAVAHVNESIFVFVSLVDGVHQSSCRDRERERERERERG